jgi:predicted nucleotidyltransferase
MIEMEKIEGFVQRLVKAYEPEQVILFGSYATGTATQDSDVDLLVVMPCEPPFARKSAEMRTTLKADFPLDLIVRSPEKLAQRISWNDFFIRDIVEKGNVLYDAAYV